MGNLPENLVIYTGVEMNAVPWMVKRNSWEEQGERGKRRRSAVGPASLVMDSTAGKALRK